MRISDWSSDVCSSDLANHTADVIQYRECGACAYRSIADYPYQRRGGVNGAAINAGFAGDDVQNAANFEALTRPDYAYTPFVPAAERTQIGRASGRARVGQSR